MTVVNQLGLYETFSSWKSLTGPPSKVAQIINIWWESRGFTLAKASNGSYNSADLLCNETFSYATPYICEWEHFPIKWKQVSDYSEIISSQSTAPNFTRGSNCADIKKGLLPLNPEWPIHECLYSYVYGDFGGHLNIALMDDGSLKYWED